ncbi:alpha/beta hydrolase [Gordonia hankookensis]|uniref:Alpha/beta hydrolase n=1 Tax=Gordonia hankookensis TaxID=589403 RepID=A0ABR7WHH9_9ACTN|nr:alpha/beta hydrolase [Gordonia hankookensis]MBD1322219.1 alpha/beta hydrolase [Gordonia hankookensis]NDZ96881.1 alpha/beta hydrolase [Streptomyces sp. SID11726]NEB26069.1 alpha/beta hydrolase [Streptomyces sp. SID6673]
MPSTVLSGRSQRALLTRVAAAVIIVLGILGLSAGPAGAAPPPKPTIVLVHGAFADATGWRDVAATLRGQGYPVQTFDNPLRGPAHDSALLEKQLAGIKGPVVLVGHSYGGAVITNTHDPDVVANVYIAAFAPARGEFVQGLLNPVTFPGSRLLPPALQLKVVDDPTGPGGKNLDGYIAQPYFRDIFAQDVSVATAADMFAHQKSAALVANLEPSGDPSWRTVPSWYLVSRQDRVIPPALQRFMASRAAKGRTSEVDASHASLVSRPGAVAAVVLKAARASQR